MNREHHKTWFLEILNMKNISKVFLEKSLVLNFCFPFSPCVSKY